MTGTPAPLPPGFIEAIAPLLKDQLGDFLASFQEQPLRGLRCSSRRAAPHLDVCGAAIPWAEDACYLKPCAQPGAHPLHWAGAYYIQEPSAMAPAMVLAPQPGEKVLDLCAAPGGKATQLADLMQRQGLLVANDPVPARALELSRNIERMGIPHAVVLSDSTERLAAAFPAFFDRVLVDAPCSGEGMFRKDPPSRAHWHPGLPGHNAKRQRSILTDAARMLKPGGRLVYSTCTFNREENEGVLEAFLHSHPDFSLVPFFLPGLPGAGEGMLRLWPHQVKGEGHFMALMEKKPSLVPAEKNNQKAPPGPLPESLRQEAQKALSEWVRGDIQVNGRLGQTLVCLPASCPDLAGLKVLRAGLHLAQQVGKTLRPDHALALAAEPRHTHPVSLKEAEAFRAGAVLEDASCRLSGYVAISLEGWPLGWGKAAHGLIKNHYPKGLRKYQVSEE